MAIYNEYRPRKLSEVVGQEKVTKTIKGMLETGKLPNALLFVGTRGTGKTTIARIVANWINCENATSDGPCNSCKSCTEALGGTSVDIIELDAASNNGVADIHRVLEMAEYQPIHKRKVIILDEVHMLSQAAFNVLLKPFEEGSRAFFILCTTEEHKIPAAITSRCSKFIFEQIADDVIASQLRKICDDKHVGYEPAALEIIARAAKGGMRDSQSILEQFMSFETITEASVKDVLGITDEGNIFNILKGIIEGRMSDSILSLREEQKKGRSMQKLAKDLQSALIVSAARLEGDDGIKGTSEYMSGLGSFVSSVRDTKMLIPLIEQISSIVQTLKTDEDIALSLQAVIATSSLEHKEAVELSERINALEERILNLEALKTQGSIAGCIDNSITKPEEAETYEDTAASGAECTEEGSDAYYADDEEPELKSGYDLSFADLGVTFDDSEKTAETSRRINTSGSTDESSADDFGFEKGEPMSLDELLDEVDGPVSGEEEGLSPQEGPSDEPEAQPEGNLFGSLFGGFA